MSPHRRSAPPLEHSAGPRPKGGQRCERPLLARWRTPQTLPLPEVSRQHCGCNWGLGAVRQPISPSLYLRNPDRDNFYTTFRANPLIPDALFPDALRSEGQRRFLPTSSRPSLAMAPSIPAPGRARPPAGPAAWIQRLSPRAPHPVRRSRDRVNNGRCRSSPPAGETPSRSKPGRPARWGG
jgi:hypothetical protein